MRNIDAWSPQRLGPQAREWQSRDDKEPLGLDEAREAVRAIDPQMVIQSVLSREWEHWGDPRWWRVKKNLSAEMDRIETHSLLADAVDEQIAHLEREIARARETSRRADVLAEIDREKLVDKLRLAGRILQVLQRARDLTGTMDGLARGVEQRDGQGPWLGDPTSRAILSGEMRDLDAVFATAEMFDVLEEAMRTSDFRMTLLGEKQVPARRADLCAALSRCLLLASPELRTALAGRAEELASAWFTQASDELMRLFLHDDPDGDGVFSMLRVAVKAAGIEGGSELGKRDYLIWLWTQLDKREDRLRAIADEAVRVAKDRFAWVRAAVMHAISKTAQKPDLCFDVETIQSREQALFFPESQCSKNDLGGVWYVGPEPGCTRPTHVDGVALPLVRANQK